MRIDPRGGKATVGLSEMVSAWVKQVEKYHSGEISRENYDKWRYNYPEYDEPSGHVKVPSQKLSEILKAALKEGNIENKMII